MATVVDEQVAVRRRLARAPEGPGLADPAFARRHALVRILLALHLPALAVLAVSRGFGAVELGEGLIPLALAWVLAGRGPAEVRATAASIGLAVASVDLVVWSGGSIEAHFHLFVLVGFVSIYQSWRALASVVVLTLAGEAVLAGHDPRLVFDHHAAIAAPWIWLGIHAAFVAAECVAMMIFWASTEQESRRASQMATEMTVAQLQRSREQAERQQASADLLTNLARRNQSLLNRQLARIDQLEKEEEDPAVLAQLFTLDHLATRMRRNAESLLVLSGQPQPPRAGGAIQLSEVARGAVAQVEDYTRADVALAADVWVHASAVGDLVHLVAELIENAATFSPPTSRVVVSGVPQHDGSYVITIDDGGIGMSDAELAEANATLREDAGSQVELSGQLGFHVVARLAARHGVEVTMARAAGIAATGLRATVHLPGVLVSPQSPDRAPVVPPWPGAVEIAAAAPEVIGPVEAQALPLPVPDQASTPPLESIPAAPPATGDDLTSSGLTRRVPRASLNPNLATPLGDPAPPAPSDAVEPDPDRARSSLDAFYGGLARGAVGPDGDG